MGMWGAPISRWHSRPIAVPVRIDNGNSRPICLPWEPLGFCRWMSSRESHTIPRGDDSPGRLSSHRTCPSRGSSRGNMPPSASGNSSLLLHRELRVKLTHDTRSKCGSAVSFLTLLGPQSRFGGKLLGICLVCPPKRDSSTKGVKLYFYQSAEGIKKTYTM